MARYAARLLLEYGVREAPSARPLCERRIVVFQAAGARAAIRRAKQLGKRAQFRYLNTEGNTVEIKFVGLVDVLDLDYVGPEEVYYSMRRMSNPTRHVRPDSELSVIGASSKSIGASWWAVPARVVATKSKAKPKGRRRGDG